MNNLVKLSVVAPPETVIKKLSRAQIALYDLKKTGVRTTFCVHDKTLKKVFAIFAHPCYNVTVVKYGAVRSFLTRASARAGALVGAALFIAIVTFCQTFVFKVEVTGSGAYLSPEVTAILRDCGVEAGKPCKNIDSPLTISRIMALPSVTFCSVSKRGTVVIVDVECDEEGSISPRRDPLVSPVAGEVVRIVAICGTPCVEAGQQVSAGDELISPRYTAADGTFNSCICVGYADIRVRASISVAAEDDSEKSLQSALSAVNLYSDGAEVLSCTVKQSSQGVIYDIDFTYIHTASINMQ